MTKNRKVDIAATAYSHRPSEPAIFLPKPEVCATSISPAKPSWPGDWLSSGATDIIRCLNHSACNPERELKREKIFYLDPR
jgi:hypothetical protein